MMEKFKIIKILNCNVKTKTTKEPFHSQGIKSSINLHHVKLKDKEEYYSYISLKENNEYETNQYRVLLKECFNAKDSLIDFYKIILPIDSMITDIIISLMHDIAEKKQYTSIIFDISEAFFTTKDFLSKLFLDLYSILYYFHCTKIILITKLIEDFEDYKKFVNTYKYPLEKLYESSKELIFIREDGCFLQKNKAVKRIKEFTLEHLRYLLSSTNNKYYGHIEASNDAHIWVFQHFEIILTEYNQLFYLVIKDLLESKIKNDKIDGLISLVFPRNGIKSLGPI